MPSGWPAARFFYVPGPLEPVRVNLDDWPGWRLNRERVQRLTRAFPRRVPLPRGPAVVWVGTPWVAYVPPPPASVPGTPEGDLDVVLDSTASADARLAALERTIARVGWYPRRPDVRRALAARAAGQSVDDAMQQELRAAVYLVLAERSRPQSHRFGRRWVTDGDGRAAAILPEGLPPRFFWRWFCDEVRKAAEASLVGEPYPAQPSHARRPTVSGDDVEVLTCAAAAASDPLELVLRRERAAEAAAAWGAALRLATPRQRDLLDALWALDRSAESGTTDLARAAALAGMAPSTARVQWKRLVDRLRAERPFPT